MTKPKQDASADQDGSEFDPFLWQGRAGSRLQRYVRKGIPKTAIYDQEGMHGRHEKTTSEYFTIPSSLLSFDWQRPTRQDNRVICTSIASGSRWAQCEDVEICGVLQSHRLALLSPSKFLLGFRPMAQGPETWCDLSAQQNSFEASTASVVQRDSNMEFLATNH